MQLHLAAASPFNVWTSIIIIVCLLVVMWRKETVQPPEEERQEVKLNKGFLKVFMCILYYRKPAIGEIFFLSIIYYLQKTGTLMNISILYSLVL